MSAMNCIRCGDDKLVFPLHGVEKGGPLVCPDCAFKITNEFNPERDKLLWAAGKKLEPRPTYLTLELLYEVLSLVHPDKHPPERAELANRVTAALNKLKPFTAPAPKPKPPPPVTDIKPSHDGHVNIRDMMAHLRFDCVA